GASARVSRLRSKDCRWKPMSRSSNWPPISATPACRRFRTRSGRSPARRRRSFRKRNKAFTTGDSRCSFFIKSLLKVDGWPGRAQLRRSVCLSFGPPAHARLIVIRPTLNPCNKSAPIGFDLPAMNNAFFSDLLASISERGRALLRRAGSSNGKGEQDASDLIELCEALLSGRGEASGTAMAREVIDRYQHLDEAGRLSFFETLARNYGPDRGKLTQAIEAWRAQP